MIKIHHTDIKQICRDYTDVVMSINRRFNISNQYIAYVFNERNFKDIVSCPAINLHNEIDMFHKRFPEIEHKSYWAVKQCNLDYQLAGRERKLQL